MRKTIIFLSAVALSATTLSFAGVAFARPGDGPAREPLTRADVESRTNEAFSRLDVNGDGVLGKADREAGFAEHFARADSDGNGQLSLAEASAARDARRTEWQDRVGERRRGDGPRGEGRMGRGDGRGPKGLAGFVLSADADGDRQISAAEFSSTALARFDRVDADNDGTITRDEFRAMRGPDRPKRGRSGE